MPRTCKFTEWGAEVRVIGNRYELSLKCVDKYRKARGLISFPIEGHEPCRENYKFRIVRIYLVWLTK